MCSSSPKTPTYPEKYSGDESYKNVRVETRDDEGEVDVVQEGGYNVNTERGMTFAPTDKKVRM